MTQRLDMNTTVPEVYRAMLHLSSASAAKSTLTPIQKELIKMRASQINSCAFCINMHTKDALALGETQQRIFLLNAWRETNLFSAEEKAILAITEEVTLLSQHGVSDEVYQQAEQFFNTETIAHIIMAAVVINAWNRIAVSTHMPLGN
jgi:AhpD family alkylhydroperoxidase